MSNLSGQYHFANTTLQKNGSPDLKMVIASRKKPTPQKPKYYLLLALPAGRFQYVSSLYPLPEGAENGSQGYSLDWQGKVYTLELDAQKGQATISAPLPTSWEGVAGQAKMPSNPPSNPTGSINNVGSGVKNTPYAGI